MELEYAQAIVDMAKVHGFVSCAPLTIPPDLLGRQMNHLHQADSSASSSHRSLHRPNNPTLSSREALLIRLWIDVKEELSYNR
jgi:hypothetical protein